MPIPLRSLRADSKANGLCGTRGGLDERDPVLHMGYATEHRCAQEERLVRAIVFYPILPTFVSIKAHASSPTDCRQLR
jgi:hypothetical protein